MTSTPEPATQSSTSRMVVLAAVTSMFVACGVSEREDRADLVLTGGNVVTMNEAAPSAEAIAVRGDRILAVGTIEEIGPFIGSDTRQGAAAAIRGARHPGMPGGRIDRRARSRRLP